MTIGHIVRQIIFGDEQLSDLSPRQVVDWTDDAIRHVEKKNLSEEESVTVAVAYVREQYVQQRIREAFL